MCCCTVLSFESVRARRTVNDLIWKEIQEKNTQFKADNDAYWEQEQVWRKWQNEDRRRKCAPPPLCLPLPSHPSLRCRCLNAVTGGIYILPA